MSDSSILQRWLTDMRHPRSQQVPPIVCKNGLVMSVQASEFHYCTPRENQGPWTAVEIGFPNREIPELAEYGEYDIYSWVPIELVEKIIEANGGIGDSQE